MPVPPKDVPYAQKRADALVCVLTYTRRGMFPWHLLWTPAHTALRLLQDPPSPGATEDYTSKYLPACRRFFSMAPRFPRYTRALRRVLLANQCYYALATDAAPPRQHVRRAIETIGPYAVRAALNSTTRSVDHLCDELWRIWQTQLLSQRVPAPFIPPPVFRFRVKTPLFTGTEDLHISDQVCQAVLFREYNPSTFRSVEWLGGCRLKQRPVKYTLVIPQ